MAPMKIFFIQSFVQEQCSNRELGLGLKCLVRYQLRKPVAILAGVQEGDGVQESEEDRPVAAEHAQAAAVITALRVGGKMFNLKDGNGTLKDEKIRQC